MAVAVGDIIRASPRMRLAGLIDVVNVYHVRIDQVEDSDEDTVCGEIAAQLDTMYGLFEDEFTTGLVFADIGFKNETQDVVYPAQPWPTLEAGTSSFDVVATGVSLLMWLRTAVPRTQARKFIGGLTEASISGIAWGAGLLVIAANFAELWLTPWEGSSGNQYHFGAYDRVSRILQDVTEAVVSAIPAYQRRRRQGRGS